PGLPGILSTIGVTVAVLLVVFALFLTAGLLERLLGRVGINVVTRLLGMLLAALSVQFVLDGLRAFGMAD
ncbi:MAG: MarC family protein, partial [Pseudooceanicola nanhaiensis]